MSIAIKVPGFVIRMLETYMNYNIPGSASKLECDTIEKSLTNRVGIL